MAVLFSIAVFLFSENAPLSVSRYTSAISAENRIYFEATSAGLLGEPITQGNCLIDFTGAKYSNSEFQYKNYSACLKYTEKTISSEFIQYVFQAKNFSLRLRKSDLLFPFHYFW